MQPSTTTQLPFASRAATASAYSRAVPANIDLFLDANEGPALNLTPPPPSPDLLRRYPDSAPLERAIAAHYNIDPARVIVTAGGDDAITRLCQTFLEPGRSILLHDPTFVMIARSAALAGADLIRIPWIQGPFPTPTFLNAITDNTTLIALVSPNNPTGLAIDPHARTRIINAARDRNIPILFDAAYAEFEDADPTPDLIAQPHLTIVRTFSKAFSLAGLRVGYAIAPATIAPRLRAVASPYPCSAYALDIALNAWHNRAPMLAAVERIRHERDALTATLTALNLRLTPSQANFIFARTPHATHITAALAARGIAIRSFPSEPSLADALRITLPGCTASFDRLTRELTSIITHLNSEQLS
ncbi:MAG: histidinol-phosphate aminotransferase family protein [Phycisphaeraceae bacterium]|nr:histidinol-phosphate aminotransferase family protein [Phycisphaeraceae bacterium]MCW5763968.1 histidinol-phosphate aminotransferase family protein [Phycisphaeraceae bacterium]